MYSFIDTRNKKILKELIKSNGPTTGRYLSKVTGVTARTIRNDIKYINGESKSTGMLIKSLPSKGYQIMIQNDSQYNQFLRHILKKEQMQEPTIPSLPEDRVNYIIRKFLSTNSYITLEEIANELYVSKTTIDNDLYRVEEALNDYELTLEKKRNYGVKIKGDEFKIRLCIAHFLIKENNPENLGRFSSKFKISMLEAEDLNQIKGILLKHTKDVKLKLTDLTLCNLVIHIAIAIKRIKSGYKIKSTHLDDIEKIHNAKEYAVAQKITNDLQSLFNIAISQEETLYITIHLLSKKIIVDNQIDYNQLKEVIGTTTIKIIDAILETIKKTYYIDLSYDDDLIWNLALHLKPALNRIKYGMSLENPILEEIKTNYAYPFEMAITASKNLFDLTGTYVNEDEIGYIALHFAAALERLRLKNKDKIKHILIVCTSGIGTAKLLEAKVKKLFNNISSITTLPMYRLDKKKLENIDLILTTVPLDIQTHIPLLQVSALLRDEDIELINRFLNQENLVNIPLKQIRNHVNNLFSKGLFIKDLDCDNDIQIIKKMSRLLKEEGYVDDSFETYALSREKISSTAYGNLVAMPHAINNKGEELKIAVSILKRPIDWGKHRVQFVLMMILPRQIKQELEEVFGELNSIINDKNLVTRLIEADTYETFMKIINTRD